MSAQRYKAPWERRWLVFAFTVRTVLLILESLRAVASDRLVRLVCKLLPWALKRGLGP